MQHNKGIKLLQGWGEAIFCTGRGFSDRKGGIETNRAGRTRILFHGMAFKMKKDTVLLNHHLLQSGKVFLGRARGG